MADVRQVAIVAATTIAAPAARVWTMATERIGAWFGPPLVATSASQAVLLDLRPGGLLWEDRGSGSGQAWGTVRAVRRHRGIEFEGPFRLPGALAGELVLSLDDEGGATRVQIVQRALGAVSADDEAERRQAWEQLLEGLRSLVEAVSPKRDDRGA